MEDEPGYRLSASVQDGITVVVMTGRAERDTIQDAAVSILAMVREKKIKELLIDVRAFRGPRSYTDTYYRVRSYPADFDMPRVAFVDIEENAEFRAFHETTARNAGLPLKCFTDIETAMTWLKSR
jgi:hypothetical protein